MNRFFRCFCINRFGFGPLHYHSSHSDFGSEFLEIFVIKKNNSPHRWVAESTRLPRVTIFFKPLALTIEIVNYIPDLFRLPLSPMWGVDYFPYQWCGSWRFRVFRQRLPESSIWRVGDSPYHWYAELLGLPVSPICGVADSPYHRYVESPTPRLIDAGSHRLSVSPMRGAHNLLLLLLFHSRKA